MSTFRFLPSTGLPTRRSSILAVLLCVGGLGANAAAQEPPGDTATRPDWNSTQVLSLVSGAREVRQASVEDTTLNSYRARARGFVYFYLDRTDGEEQALVKADQVALDVFWQAPDLTRQRIVGMRDEERLPTNIRYHLDHLTVVQDDFQDLIRMGEGDEVEAVVHPVAPGAETLYDYRLADSLSLDYAGLDEPVRVYQVQVRPRDADRPGFVGALYLDRRTRAIVRMAFTFTPASYVDPYLDYIRVSLDNALWLGRHWLPYRQEVELRRELPQVDFLAGSIIRGRWEVGDYVFNEPVPAFIVQGPRVSAAPERQRRNFEFSSSLFADMEDRGLAPSGEMDEVRRQARELMTRDVLGGLDPLRLHLSRVSDLVRRNRVEGWSLGLGVSLRQGDRPLRVLGGYGTAARRPWIRTNYRFPLGAATISLEGAWNDLQDIGPWPGASGVINTLATLGGRDYTDPFWTHGGAVTGEWNPGSGDHRLRLGLQVERHESAQRNVDDQDGAFRPVLPVRDGDLVAGMVEWLVPDLGRGLFGGVRLEAGRLGDRYGRVDLRIGWARTGPSHTVEGSISLESGLASGETPPQRLYLLGGRATLPGFDYRGTVGDRYTLARGFVRRTLADPWISLRATGAAGWSDLGSQALPAGWSLETSTGLRGSLGIGADLLWEVIQLDVARGVPDGDWAVFLSISPRLAAWL